VVFSTAESWKQNDVLLQQLAKDVKIDRFSGRVEVSQREFGEAAVRAFEALSSKHFFFCNNGGTWSP
jgi:hypothetical protein